MLPNGPALTAIDLYSGIGGWSLGLQMAGIEVRQSYEWWPEANATHRLNFSNETFQVDIRQLAPESIERVDFVVGSPPCTQFSFANRGGSGDLEDGLVDVAKFLEIVEALGPRHWAMENVLGSRWEARGRDSARSQPGTL